MFKQLLIFSTCILVCNFFVSAQDFPYPVSPTNTGVVNNFTPTLTWTQSFNFNSYKIEIEMCNYDEGSSFDVLDLEDYIYAEVKNGPNGYETSALTYSLRRPGNYTTVDDDGRGFTDYQDNFSKNQTFPNTPFAGEDYEGLTYLYNNYFAMVEEREDYLIFLEFNYNNQSEVTSITEVNTLFMNNSFISGNNDGWEGLTYNPKNNKLYLAKEYNPTYLFETSLPSGNNFTGSVNLTQPFNINNTSWVPTDVSGLFHLSLDLAVSATPAGNHILILSQEDDKIFEVDMDGNLISEKEFNMAGVFGSVANGKFKAEGITFQKGDIWIASDTDIGSPGRYFRFSNPYYQAPTPNNTGLIHTKDNITSNQYQVPSGTLANSTEYCWRVIGITASGLEIPSQYYSLTTSVSPSSGCTDGTACNFDTNATIDDGSCQYLDCLGNCGGPAVVGTSCNDNDITTGNDVYLNDCTCKGQQIQGCIDVDACNYNSNATVNDNSCLFLDCEGVCGGSDILGAPCDDNNPSTQNDKYNGSCICEGDPLLGCTYANACNFNPLAAVNDGSCKYVVDCLGNCDGPVTAGTACNDNDPFTINDVYDLFCNCKGTLTTPTNGIYNICFDINNGNDDVEEIASSGNLDFTSSDLDLADQPSKITGLYFKNVTIPPGANILNAFLQFEAAKNNTQLTNLNISVENSSNANSINNTNSNISSRNYYNNTVQWNNVLTWLAGQKGVAQKSPSLAQLVQQVVNKNGWQANNSMLFKIEGTGKRAATSYNGGVNATQLCVEYLPLSCPQSLTLTNQVENDQTISVEMELESSSNIINSSVNYFAGDTIVLMKGFETDLNSNFSAVIQDCQ